jgi:hypothetical protein
MFEKEIGILRISIDWWKQKEFFVLSACRLPYRSAFESAIKLDGGPFEQERRFWGRARLGFKFFYSYFILKASKKMLSFKKINNFNILDKFQPKA